MKKQYHQQQQQQHTVESQKMGYFPQFRDQEKHFLTPICHKSREEQLIKAKL